jgi:hypothetical protein
MTEQEAKRERIREQSKQVANYIQTNEKFEDWFYEMEGFGFRAERFYNDCEYGNNECLRNWLKAAYDMGFEAGRGVCD